MSDRIVSHTGNQAVVEMSTQKTPEVGSTVSVNGRKVGRVFDVIGNVKKPHVVVKLSSKLKDKLVGRQISWGK